MIDLNFHVECVEVSAHAAAPMLMFRVRVSEPAATTAIQTIALRCQVRIEPARRRYSKIEQALLLDLFGEPHRYAQTLRSMLWAHTSAIVPPFVGTTVVELPVPCTYDFNLAEAKYFNALEDGQVPLCLLFSGTIFYANDDGALQVAQIPWEKECDFRLPVDTWKRMMDRYYPNTAWLTLRKDVFDRLCQFRTRTVSASWEQTVGRLLDLAEPMEAPSVGDVVKTEQVGP